MSRARDVLDDGLPPTSSGANWTEEEDEFLWVMFNELTKKFPGRSLAAVYARLERNWPAWWVRRVRDNKK